MQISEVRRDQVRRIGLSDWHQPFEVRTWRELFYLGARVVLLPVGLSVLFVAAALGGSLSILFVGVVVLAGGIGAARGLGAIHRALARSALVEDFGDRPPFQPRPGFFGWLGSALWDRAGWPAIVYLLLKAPMTVAGVRAA